MKRNIYILTLTMLFFVSTTGLPLTLHLCKMNPEAEMCAMCSSEPVEVKLCCSMEPDYPVKISASAEQCCEVKVVEPSVKDDFLFSKTESANEIHVVLMSDQLTGLSDNVVVNRISYSDNSPPGLVNNRLYIINSIFLI